MWYINNRLYKKPATCRALAVLLQYVAERKIFGLASLQSRYERISVQKICLTGMPPLPPGSVKKNVA